MAASGLGFVCIGSLSHVASGATPLVRPKEKSQVMWAGEDMPHPNGPLLCSCGQTCGPCWPVGHCG